MRDAIDTKTLRAAFVQAQAQIMNNGTYTPVVVIDKGMALQLLDEIEYLKSLLADLLTDCENWGCDPNERYAEALR